MATENKEEKKKKTVQIKVSTGAWWKSTASDNEEPQDDSGGVEQEKKKPGRPRRSPQSGKTTGKKKTPVKKTGAETTGEAPQESPPAPSTKAPRKKKAPPKKEKLPPQQEQETVAEQQAPEGNDQETVTPKTKSPGRGRRGRKPKKKVQSEDAKGAEAPEGIPADQEKDDAARDPKDAQARTPADKPKTDDTGAASEQQAVDEAPAVGEKKVCKLLINAEEPEECRLALLEDGRLESIHLSTITHTHTKNNIYKAKIVAIEPSLQAAFVDYGTEKNGFLPFSEIHPEYYRQKLSKEVAHLVETHQWKKLNITDVIEKGQEILAQVVKEEVGKKGANMTTFLSIPGRCVVLMPGSDSSGISRKISGEERRSQLRETMRSIEMPEGIGWIVRTASVDINPNALERDVKYLLKLWDEIKTRGQEMDGVGLVYEDHQSVTRFLREHFDPAIEEILVDDKDALQQVQAFIELLPQNQRKVKVRLHQGARPIFNQYSIEEQIESIYQPQVNLPSGGSIVIEPTEALVSIDVNSGSTSKGKNFEASIFQANMEAASELARQLRLRDLGGLIVVDFIDMRNRKNILAVEKQLKAAMKKDKAKVDFTRISKFGLMQISRQKLGAPIETGNYHQCEYCKGRGTVKSVEARSLYFLRRIQTGASRKQVESIECTLPLDVASYLLNHKRSELAEMEEKYKVEIMVNGDPDMKPMDNELVYHKAEKENNSKKQA